MRAKLVASYVIWNNIIFENYNQYKCVMILGMVTHDGHRRRFPCMKCGRSYVWKAHLNRHMIYECDVEPKFKCQYCSKPFRHLHVLRKHTSLCQRRYLQSI